MKTQERRTKKVAIFGNFMNSAPRHYKNQLISRVLSKALAETVLKNVEKNSETKATAGSGAFNRRYLKMLLNS